MAGPNDPNFIKGRFAPGNKLASGNPNTVRAARLKAALFRCVDKNCVVEMTEAMIKKAKQGDVAAYKVLMDRLLGKPTTPVEITNEGTPLALSLTDIQVAIFAAIKDDPEAKLKIASALSQLTHKATNGNGASNS